MSIPVTTDLNYIDALRDKIRELERLNKLKESENKILRDVLKEIGAVIKVEYAQMKELPSGDFYDTIPVDITSISYNRRFASRAEFRENLKRIDGVLDSYVGYVKRSI